MTCWDNWREMIMLSGGRPHALRGAVSFKLLHPLFQS